MNATTAKAYGWTSNHANLSEDFDQLTPGQVQSAVAALKDGFGLDFTAKIGPHGVSSHKFARIAVTLQACITVPGFATPREQREAADELDTLSRAYHALKALDVVADDL
jgi:hypothetical protein